VKLAVINGLRGWAILAVIYHHACAAWLTPPGTGGFMAWNTIPVLPYTFLSNGWIGVNLFFVLSGFVLYLPYATAERHLRTRSEWAAFYKHRARRLLPLYYTSVLIMWALYAPPYDLEGFLTTFLLMGAALFNFTVHSYQPAVNPVLWSLGLEIWFSALFPVVAVAALRWGAWRVLAVVAPVALAVRLVGAYYAASFFYGNDLLNPVKDSLPGRLDDFVVGMALCALFMRNPGLRWRTGRSVGMIVAGVACLFVAATAWDLVQLKLIPYTTTAFLNILVLVGLGFVLYALLRIDWRPVRWWVDNRLIQITGMMSYSLYVWHHKIVDSVYFAAGNRQTVLALVIIATLTALVALFSYRYIEFGHVRDVRKVFAVADGARPAGPAP